MDINTNANIQIQIQAFLVPNHNKSISKSNLMYLKYFLGLYNCR